MASHQFRTPLTIIQSGIEIMDMYLEDMTAEVQKNFINNLPEYKVNWKGCKH